MKPSHTIPHADRRPAVHLLSALLIALALVLVHGLAHPASAQDEGIPESMRARTLPRQHLAGPRFGITTFTGEVADIRRELGHSIFMSQFGWQFETQVVSTSTGNQALMEWVILVGGFEQEMQTLSVSWLAGYRFPNGFELGIGPNLGVQLNGSGGSTTSMITAVGTTAPFGDIYVPVNVAVAWARGGPRVTTLLGWIIG